MNNEKKTPNVIEDDRKARRIIEFVHKSRINFRTKKNTRVLSLFVVNVLKLDVKPDHVLVTAQRPETAKRYTFKTQTSPAEIHAQMVENAAQIWGLRGADQSIEIAKFGGMIIGAAQEKYEQQENEYDESKQDKEK